MPVCIGGMHRSGTSMVARLLNVCGLYLGPEHDLMPARPDNPEGFWENVRFVKLNDDILHDLGGGWDHPPPRLAGSWTATLPRRIEPVRELLAEFEQHDHWGWKDPRNSLTLPFWLELRPDIRVIVCVRNPLEVALSLSRRNYLSFSLGLELWKTYNERLLAFVPREQRIVTHYDSFFLDPRTELENLLDFVGLRVSETAIDQATSVAKKSLRHQVLTTQHLVDADISVDILNLYAELCFEAGHAELPPRAVSEVAVAPHASEPGQGRPPRTSRSSGRQNGAGERRRVMESGGRPMRQMDKSAVELAVLRRELEGLRASAAAREDHVRDLQAMLEERAEDVRRAVCDSAQRESALRDLQEQLSAVRGERESLKQTVADQMELFGGLTDEVRMLSRRGEELGALLHEAREQLLRRDDEIQAALYDLELSDAVAGDVPGDERRSAYRRMVRRIREVVRSALPRDARVIVVNKGDPSLLSLYGRQAFNFPQAWDGTYPGYYPATNTAAIAQLETLRAKGAEYILFPSTSLWWLEHYARFARYLDQRYQVLLRQDDTCLIFDLRRPSGAGTRETRTGLDEVVAAHRARFGREPAILDWQSGLDLAATYPTATVFSPPLGDTLPYLDGSVDIVVAPSDADHLAEAGRVASGAIFAVAPAARGGAVAGLELHWRSEELQAELPSVSIIIPSYNGMYFTEKCLVALRETLPADLQCEIIIVDDASTDNTPVRLARLAEQDDRVKVLRNPENLHFLATNNRAAEIATGEYIVLLNNDTIPLPGWLEPLLNTFSAYPDAGVVGGKLIFPDGVLQEAGGIVYSDASGANFGKWEHDAEDPLFTYVREVDYVSGALLVTKRSLWREIGGFDTRFRPIYYEDSDYCFQVRERGYRVYYQPESVVIHVEGGHSGRDISTGDKRYQAVNRDKFIEKWKDALRRQPDPPSRYEWDTLHLIAVREEIDREDGR